MLPRLPVLLLADNAEDLLTPAPAAGRSRIWTWRGSWPHGCRRRRGPGCWSPAGTRSRCPAAAGTAAAWHHLGPLSLAETRKLIWRLPALDALPAADQQRAHAMVGGHPRTLEYLDALLRGGDAVLR